LADRYGGPPPSDPGRLHERSLDMRIGLTEVFVDDQDKAHAFYAGVLG
jgi:hypothetical protein